MAAPYIVTNVVLEVEASRDTAITVTAVTNANPGVATAPTHGLTDGDYVILVVSSGMTQLNGQVCRVAGSDTNTFQLEGVDTTNYGTWDSGTCEEILTWSTYCNATAINLGGGGATEVDTSNFCSLQQEVGYGLAPPLSGTIEAQHAPFNAAQAKFKAARQSDNLAVRFTRNDSSIAAYGVGTSFSGGSNAALNAVETTSIPITVRGTIVNYAS